MSADTTDWTELSEFAGVDLTSSYVLSWGVEADVLLIDIDLYLLPDHPHYEEPRPAEKACIRAAFIEFPWCTRAAASGDAKAMPVADSIGKLGTGRITGFRRTGEGKYEMSGEFSSVLIDAERPMIRLKNIHERKKAT